MPRQTYVSVIWGDFTDRGPDLSLVSANWGCFCGQAGHFDARVRDLARYCGQALLRGMDAYQGLAVCFGKAGKRG